MQFEYTIGIAQKELDKYLENLEAVRNRIKATESQLVALRKEEELLAESADSIRDSIALLKSAG